MGTAWTRSGTGRPRPFTRGCRTGNLSELVKQEDSLQPDENGLIPDVLISFLCSNNAIGLFKYLCPINSHSVGLVGKEYFKMPVANGDLFGVDAPHFYIAVPNSEIKENFVYYRHLMRNFEGLQQLNATVRSQLLQFSNNLTLGVMDSVFKVLKLIKNEQVWRNLAKMCVHARRLDVARVCLGKMNDSWGANILREAQKKYPQTEAQVAVLAMHLGMLPQAEILLNQCERYDLLVQMYKNSGQWDKALKIAETSDRRWLRTTRYQYAKYLKQRGLIEEAIEQFESANTHLEEVLRMLVEDPDRVWEFVNSHNDPKLYQWAGRYFEENEKYFDRALECFEKAEDFLSQVRMLTQTGKEDDWQRALDIGAESGDRAACFFLGKQLEARGQIEEAIHKFCTAKAHSTASRLAKEESRYERLFALASQGHKTDKLEAAKVLQGQPGFENEAAILYDKAGQTSYALEFAFERNLFSAIQQIVANILQSDNPSVSSALITRCVDFFVKNAQFDRAVELLASSKRFEEALDICVHYHVQMTEELCDLLSPSATTDEVSKEYLGALGDHCARCGQYKLACQKFTEAGDRALAMKCLLKSGDTERIILFAQVSKEREIYVMAANYLQRLDTWRSDPEMLRQIIQFYIRGKAMELLANFYECCAQADIDDYQNYEKALNALSEAYKVIGKIKDPSSSRLEDLKAKMVKCKKFAELQKMLSAPQSRDEGLKICRALVAQCQSIEDEATLLPLRLGHIYATLIHFHLGEMDHELAMQLVEEFLRKLGPRKGKILQYLDKSAISSIYKSVGKKMPQLSTWEEADFDSNKQSKQVLTVDEEEDLKFV
ncbi:hypothetical protein Ciccas_011202 [Cichlidogyrus casuarinus]|uniref:Intraflagellar transport protein 140 homolog n=1 Tax=Cichlidogyrus casuarinus TaxID=1844966 RepID=A0ABD2PTK4_9PLAT